MGAVAEEQKAHAIDAAKKKAVAQHADYDTFKKMVRHVIISIQDCPWPMPSWSSEIRVNGLVLLLLLLLLRRCLLRT